MDLATGFTFGPATPTPTGPPLPLPLPLPGPADPGAPTPSAVDPNADLGLLEKLQGQWKGTGFNAIWRPSSVTQDRFLELNVTEETLEFTRIPGNIPNRGLLQADLFMTGLRYLQQISDANLHAGLHIEPGLWLSIPATTNPPVQASVARLASIPHGTTIVAQGGAFSVAGPPRINPVDLNPFPIGNPGGNFTFPEQNLASVSVFRTPPAGLVGITQAMVDDPNSVLTSAISGQTITETIVLQVTTSATPILGGGTANTAFLAGSTDGPNADAALVTATFWIETVDGAPMQLQYTQTVLLNFNTLSWPHVTVATLHKTYPTAAEPA